MKNNTQLRRLLKKYFNHPRAIGQNETARRIHMSTSTLSEFLKGKRTHITSEQEVKILDIVIPWERDPVCVAGKLRTSLLKQYFSKDEIAIIAGKIGATTKELPN